MGHVLGAKEVSEGSLPSQYAVNAGWVLVDGPNGPDLSRDAVLIIADGKVAAIEAGDFAHSLPVLDASHHLVLPGFISAHTHTIAGLPTRGIIEAGRPYMRPLELLDGLDDDELDALTAANLAEIVRSGGTSQLEMSLSRRHAESYVRIARDWGVRGYPSVMSPPNKGLARIWFRDQDVVLENAAGEIIAGIDEGAGFAEWALEAGGDLITPMMAAHATDTQTPETLKHLKAAIDRLGLDLHIHIAQRFTERDAVQRMWGVSPVQFLEREGLLNGKVFGAHMTAVDWKSDSQTLIDRGVVYAHCPSAGGAGVSTQPYPEALYYGVPAAIGLDTHSNDCLENIKLAVIKGRVRAAAKMDAGHTDVRIPTIKDGIASSSRVTANGLGRDDLGRLRVGARADFVAVDICGPLVGSGALPPEPLNNLLYANGTAVRHVAIDGALKVVDGIFASADEYAVRRRAAQVMEKIWARLDQEKWFQTHN